MAGLESMVVEEAKINEKPVDREKVILSTPHFKVVKVMLSISFKKINWPNITSLL